MTLSNEVKCPTCDKPQKLTVAGKFRTHGPRDNPCEMSGLFLPAHLQKPLPPEAPSCLKETSPETNRNSNDATAPVRSATSTTSSGSDTTQETITSPTTSQSDTTTTAVPDSATTPTTTEAIPGSEEYAKDLAARQLEAYKGIAVKSGRPYFREGTGFQACDFTCAPDMQQCQGCESRHAVVSYDQPDPMPPEAPSEYDQPAKLNRAVTAARPMDAFEQSLAVMFKEIFYQYTNRSRRSQQTTLGPSQVGTPCDRRLVMHFLGAPKVNPGGDGWAAWVGTQIHKGLEDMLKWADAGKGRFAVEQRLKFSSSLVPGGTADLIDRTLFMIDDHKAQGQWAADKLRTSGPGDLYRTQLHVYGMGARQKGEKIERVALISWPRDKSNLDDLYVWSEPYDPQIARNALQRVEDLKAWTDAQVAQGKSVQETAAAAKFADDCRYCPYHMPDAKDLTNGFCNGRV